MRYLLLLPILLLFAILPVSCGSSSSPNSPPPAATHTPTSSPTITTSPTITSTPIPGHAFDTSWSLLGTDILGIAVYGTTLYAVDGGNGIVTTTNLTGGNPATFATSLPGGFGVAVDTSGNVYVTDAVSKLYKYNSSGINLLGTFGTGTAGNSSSQLNAPQGLDVDSSGNVYIADTNNNRIVKLDSSLAFSAAFTTAFATGFLLPYDVKVSGSNIYVLDSGRNRVVELDGSGTPVTQWGSYGNTGNGTFHTPEFLAVDHNTGNVYVSDSVNFRIELFDPNGTYLTQWGGAGTGNSQFGGNTTIDSPRGLAVDSTGKIYAVDAINLAIGTIKVFGP